MTSNSISITSSLAARNLPFPTTRRGVALLNIYDTLVNDLIASHNIWQREKSPSNKNSKYTMADCEKSAKECYFQMQCLAKCDYRNFLNYKHNEKYVFPRYRKYWAWMNAETDGTVDYTYIHKEAS